MTMVAAFDGKETLRFALLLYCRFPMTKKNFGLAPSKCSQGADPLRKTDRKSNPPAALQDLALPYTRKLRSERDDQQWVRRSLDLEGSGTVNFVAESAGPSRTMKESEKI